jgi:hypothetical protein
MTEVVIVDSLGEHVVPVRGYGVRRYGASVPEQLARLRYAQGRSRCAMCLPAGRWIALREELPGASASVPT